ncbi:hypothetical protein B0A69_04420 [Chryseobacterium shigense]|uniref:Uncharacterized protein n=1 Tax=Chryseobacterium shigense TaxID=297244 RepID=A0A1N7IQK3_9FLAO|nr:hypothetical protein [Chryseobacterium shigense]PQA95628.1 hypothetical protein B0A69_04420 [Chryseobacterium shigense]SIS39261.1 hypothetical protein SAMN05421639_104387 [Chryseobacterium shigense]
MRKLTRKELKKTIAGKAINPTDKKIPTDPIGVACGGSHCPDDNYRCCYHPAGNYCSTQTCT